MSNRGPKITKRGPKRSKRCPKRTKRGPKRNKRGPKRNKKGSRRSKRGPKEVQKRSKRGSKRTKRGSKRTKRGQKGPKEVQKGPIVIQKGPIEVQKWPEELDIWHFSSYFGHILIIFKTLFCPSLDSMKYTKKFPLCYLVSFLVRRDIDQLKNTWDGRETSIPMTSSSLARCKKWGNQSRVIGVWLSERHPKGIMNVNHFTTVPKSSAQWSKFL